MCKILVLVEGQTEEAFVKRLLAPALAALGIFAIPIILTTRRLLTGDKERGGYVPYSRIQSEIRRLLGDSSATRVTTMLDYYGLPPDFPGRKTPPDTTPAERVRSVENAWALDIRDNRFRPYLSLHEFESLLFSAPEEIATALDSPSLKPHLVQIRGQFSTPEDINDDPNTAPSRRLKGLFPSYNKPFHGELVAERIGLSRLRAECPHFSEWLSSIEALGQDHV